MSVSEWSGRPDERERADLPSSVAAPGRTPVPADTEERDGSDALSDDVRRQLAAIIAHPKMPADERRYIDGDGCDRCPAALNAADAVIAAGFRLVSEDEATVERVARVMFEGEFPKSSWDDGAGRAGQEVWRGWARAAVRALREAGQ